MYEILEGEDQVVGDEYGVADIAERYAVHPVTVYKGVRNGSPLFPTAHRKGKGPKAWLYFSAAAIAECDLNRIAFYKTTPSWHEFYGDGAASAPPRRSAVAVVASQRPKHRPGSAA
jgi:hypothetical protein